MVRAAAGALRFNFTRPSTMQLQRAGEASHRSSDRSAGCFCARGAGVCARAAGVFKAASRASLSARNRAVFSRVAARAASYSASAC
jgi:hypothetical protein